MSGKAKAEEKVECRCPNCGFCPHCGQSAKPRVIPQPYPVPYPAPYRVYPQPYYEEIGMPYYNKVWCGQTTSREGVQELRSISVSHGEAETAGLGAERLV